MEYKTLAGQKAPLRISGCSSSGDSGSEEDAGNDMTEDASKAIDNQKAAAAQALRLG